MQLTEYERLRVEQKKAIWVGIGVSSLFIGLGVWAFTARWFWAVAIFALCTYFLGVNLYLTCRLRKDGSPFVPSRKDVLRFMFTFKRMK